jgi:uncharacterized RDD family membrane protein YckC
MESRSVKEESQMDDTQFAAVSTRSASAPPTLTWHRPQPSESPQRYAGFWRRCVASAIDGVLVGIVHGILMPVLNGMLDPALELDPNASAGSLLFVISIWIGAYFVLFTVIDWLYRAGLESSSWRATLGKRVLGLAVTDLAGGRLSFGRATGRYFARFLSQITLGIGYLVQPFTAKRQALHDIVAGTLVVRA